MNKEDNMKLASYRQIQQILTKNADLYAADKATKNIINIFTSYLAQLIDLINKKEVPFEWLTREKTEIKKALLIKGYKISTAMVCFANANHNIKILSKVKITKANLAYINEIDLMTYLHQLIDVAKDNISKLGDFSLKAEYIIELENDLKAFELKSSERRMLLAYKKNAQAKFKVTKQNINLLLKNELDWAIENYRSEQPDFANQYFAVRKSAKTHYRHIDVIGYIIDEESRLPISYGQVSVEELDLCTTITKNGSFRFKKFPEGKFTLKIERMGYETLLFPICRYTSEHSKLHIKMKAVPLQKPYLEE